ncbi:MAG: carboxypeptidase-like regulatory domain-containing protein [Flavobacteriia bacterium]|nr:MAG: carboxypeptidase-like regulatory domain-containing protein [Flavobacteriia bacterium]
MQKLLLFFLFFSFAYTSYAQEDKTNDNLKDIDSVSEEIVTKLKGRVISVTTKKPLQSAHIINLNSVRGTITNSDGQFEISASPNDTIYISYIGYQSIKLKITRDLLKGNELEIAIHEKVVKINEVMVKSHRLIGVLVVDAKNVPQDRYSRIYIDGLPQAYESGSMNFNTALSAIFNPVDFWYNKLGKKSKEMKRLKKLKEGDDVRSLMEQKYSREVILDYLDMSRKELNDLLTECNYSQRFIERASDLQIIEAFLECYENHRAIQKGHVKQNIIHLRDSLK